MHKCESLGGKFSKSKQAEQRLRFPKILGMKSLSHMEDIMLCYTKTTAGREPFMAVPNVKCVFHKNPYQFFGIPATLEEQRKS